MTNQKISVQEAIEITGKSQATINRFCKKHIKTKYVQKMEKGYMLELDFLLKTYTAITEKKEAEKNNKADNVNAYERLIKNLEHTIEILKKELDAKNKQLSDMTESSKAQIYLIRELQQAIPEKAQSYNIDSPPRLDQNRELIKMMLEEEKSCEEIAESLNAIPLITPDGQKYTLKDIEKFM